MEGIWLAQENFKRHDPIGLVKKHCIIVKNFKAYNHEDDPFDIIFQRSRDYQEVSQRIHELRSNPKMQEFLNWKFNRKKSFLKEKSEKQGTIQINVDEEEDVQFESETEHDQNTYVSDMQVEKQDQHDDASGKEDKNKANKDT
jgi:hypothetical protein